MKKFTAILLTVIMVASLFVSCNNSIAPTVTDETVSVSFTEAASRSLTASLEEFNKGDYYWKYAAQKNTADGTGLNSGATVYYDEANALWIKGDTSSDDNKGLGSVAGFSQGIWDFKLFAYKKVGTAAKLAYQGEVTGVSLKKGSANTVSVTVSPVAGDKGTLVLADSISLAPAKTGNVPTGLTKVYTVTALGGTAAISPDKNQTKQWTLEAGAYKVNVDFVKDGFTYASGSVVATVYSNITTTVSGDLAELVTKAEFDSSINPDVMNKEASSGSVDLGTSQSDVILKDATTIEASTVVAKVPADAASQIINTVTGGAPSAKNTIDLALRVDTVSATNTTLELEIGMQATVTQIDAANKVINQTTQKVTELKDSTGASVISVVTIKLQPGLRNVVVKHNGTTMSDLSVSTNGQGYSYNANSGILTIKTSSFSPFTVTYDAPDYVAKVGEKKYASLGGALNDAANGSTVVVLKDIAVSSPITVDSGNNITLDLNGMNIVADLSGVGGANSLIDTDGTSLEIKDSAGTGKIVSNEYAITASNGGTITITNGTIEAGYAVLAGNNTTGDMNFIINGGTLTSTQCEAIYMPGQQTLTITGGTINGGISARMGQINISGGTINGMTSGQAADSFDEYWNYSGSAWIGDAIYVWGGTYTSANATYGNSCNITIIGGTINGNAHRAIAVYDIANKYDQSIAVNISGDAVVNGTIVEDHSKDQGLKNVTTTWNIIGGAFTNNPTEYLAEGYRAVKDGASYRIESACAMYNDEYYYSVNDAVTARGTSGSIKTITLTRDVSENISLQGYTSLDLNTFTVTGNIEMEEYDSLRNGTVIGIVTDRTKAAPSNNDKNGIYNCTVTKFVLDDGCNRENVTIEDSTIGDVEVGNRYYSSGSAGLLTFKNSHVTGDISVGSETNPYSGSMGSGWGYGSKVRFLGGTYEGTITLSDSNSYNNVIEIVTGTFSKSVDEAFLNSGSAVKEEDGKYIVYKIPAARVGETTYETLEKACAAAMEGENHTVTVLVDGNVETTVEVTDDLVFDLNGHTVQAGPSNNRAFYIQENGHLTIVDSSEAKTGLLESVSSSNAETIYFKGGNSSLIVNGGTIKSPSKPIAAQGVKAPYSITINGGKVWSTGNSAVSLNADAPVTFVMNGGTIEGNSYSGTIFQGSSYTYKGTDKNIYTIMGGTINRKSSNNLYISTGGKIATTVNIAKGMDFQCNTGDGITVNSNYTETSTN